MFHTPAHKQPAVLVAIRASEAIPTLPEQFKVTTVFAGSGGSMGGVVTRVFGSARAAERHMVEETKWESTLTVSCPELGISASGDFVGLSHLL